jgi:hypothetical protein
MYIHQYEQDSRINMEWILLYLKWDRVKVFQANLIYIAHATAIKVTLVVRISVYMVKFIFFMLHFLL